MHELSIAHSIVNTSVDALAHVNPFPEVVAVHVQIGAISGVVSESLHFCWDVATAGTPLAGSRLEIEELPVIVHCPDCQENQTLPGLFPLRCPTCNRPTRDIVQGKELEIRSLELNEPALKESAERESAEKVAP